MMSTPRMSCFPDFSFVGVGLEGIDMGPPFGSSWWFRYSATHRAAQFWGPQAAELIRDAPHVTLRSAAAAADGQDAADAAVPRDVSHAKGLTHLRNALLEDARC